MEKPLLDPNDGAPTAGGATAAAADEQQEKKALCISIASMVLSIPALIVRPLLPQPISQPHNLSRAAHRAHDVGRPS